MIYNGDNSNDDNDNYIFADGDNNDHNGAYDYHKYRYYSRRIIITIAITTQKNDSNDIYLHFSSIKVNVVDNL